MTSALRINFDLACSAEHAFEMWTSRIGSWWPADHTVSGAPGMLIVLESGVGGRIYERSPEGVEHDWGVVTLWEPPRRLGYVWHLGRDREDATDVHIRFVPAGANQARVEIEHRGWERLGEMAEAWRDRNRIGWETLLPHYAAAVSLTT